MIPANEWWMIIHRYSETVFPAQIFFYVFAIVTIGAFHIMSEKNANWVIKGFFTLAFAWIGIIFFQLNGQNLPAHYVQSLLFLSLSALFAIDLFTNSIQVRIPENGWRRFALITGFFLVIIVYPMIGLVLGRPFFKWIIPGIFPCPTTALALVYMSTAFLPNKRQWIYYATLCLLLIWAIPFPIMIQIPKFGVYEDAIMLATGVFNLVILAFNMKTKNKANLNKQSRQDIKLVVTDGSNTEKLSR